MKAFIFVFFFAVAILLSIAADPIPVFVKDGDTFAAGGVTYRIWGIDAPERGQPWADVSSAALTAMMSGRVFAATQRGTSYGRVVAAIDAEGHDVGLSLIRMGLAWHDRRYAPKRDDYAAAMQQAKEERRGLWFDPAPVSPWEYRANKKTSNKRDE